MLLKYIQNISSQNCALKFVFERPGKEDWNREGECQKNGNTVHLREIIGIYLTPLALNPQSFAI